MLIKFGMNDPHHLGHSSPGSLKCGVQIAGMIFQTRSGLVCFDYIKRQVKSGESL